MDANRLWGIYGRHGMRLYGTDTFTGWANDRAFALLTGEPSLDLNICCLQPGATAGDAAALLEVIDSVGAPTVVPVSTRALGAAGERLRTAGFQPLGPEVAMWRPPGLPVEVAGPFEVRLAVTADELVAADRVVAEAHGTVPGMLQRVFNLDAWRTGEVECWMAWDAEEAASTGWITRGEGFLGVWEMMTSPRYRRRGAARAILQHAMRVRAGGGPEGTLLWASPMGRPLYESLGFVVFDEIVPWVRGGTNEELAAIGAVVQPRPGAG